MTQGVVLLGKGTLAIRIADWFSRQPQYDLRMVVPVMPEPAWTDSLADAYQAAGHIKPGSSAPVLIRRTGREMELTVKPQSGS